MSDTAKILAEAMSERYLGDGLYAAFDGHQITIAAAQDCIVTDEMIKRAETAFYEQQEGSLNFTAGMRAAITAALSQSGRAANVVYLEPETLLEFERYVAMLRETFTNARRAEAIEEQVKDATAAADYAKWQGP